MKGPYRHGFSPCFTNVTFGFARAEADAANYGGEGHRGSNHGQSLVPLTFADETVTTWYVQLGWASILTWCILALSFGHIDSHFRNFLSICYSEEKQY